MKKKGRGCDRSKKNSRKHSRNEPASQTRENELCKLEENAYGQSPAYTDTFISSFNTPDRVRYRTWEPNDPGLRTMSVSSESRDSASQLQNVLGRQQNTMDEVVRGLRMPQRE